MNTAVTIDPANINVDKNVDPKECSYGFKKDKLGNKRPTVKGNILVPSVEGVVAILEAGGKQFSLLQEAMFDVIRSTIAEEVGNNENLKSLDEVDMSKYSWKAISEMDKADRRSSTIPEEVWKGFTEDYIKVMQPLTGKSVDAVTNATVVYLKKFAPWKSDKKTIGLLKQQLAIYAEQPSAEEFSEILDLLVKRADTYLAANDLTQVAQNL